MRVGRRSVLLTVAMSSVAAVAFLAGAAVHRADAFHSATRLHLGAEVLLWSGAVLAGLAFAWGLRRLRIEVNVEKHRRQRREVRDEYLREVRDYELTRSGPGGRWNN